MDSEDPASEDPANPGEGDSRPEFGPHPDRADEPGSGAHGPGGAAASDRPPDQAPADARGAEFPPGWYRRPDGNRRYWDGKAWLDVPAPDEQAAGTPSVPRHTGGKRRLSPRVARVLAIVAAAVVLIGAGTGALATRSAHQRQAHAAASASARASASRSAAAASASASAAAAEAEASASAAADDAEQVLREASVDQLESDIKKMAQQDVKEGLLDGPILGASCQPSDGSSVDDTSVSSTNFSCIAATENNSDGSQSGYRFHATMNWDTGEYQYGLGDG